MIIRYGGTDSMLKHFMGSLFYFELVVALLTLVWFILIVLRNGRDD